MFQPDINYNPSILDGEFGGNQVKQKQNNIFTFLTDTIGLTNKNERTLYNDIQKYKAYGNLAMQFNKANIKNTKDALIQNGINPMALGGNFSNYAAQQPSEPQSKQSDSSDALGAILKILMAFI